MLTPLLLIVSLSTLAVAQCPCYHVNGNANSAVCNSTTITTIPDCVASNITSLGIWTPSIPLEAATFERFTALTTLGIAWFDTPIIAKDMLKYLGFLQFFDIFATDVEYIDNEWFMYSPRITTLFLQSNRLSYLAPDTFLYLPRLEVVSLSNNQIKSLAPALFHGTSITTVYLSFNPWHCDCELANFMLWAQETGVQIESDYASCAYPDDLQGLNIKNLTTSLACK